MTNMSIQPLWLTHFSEIIMVLEFQLTKFIVGMFSYKAHFRPQISSNENWPPVKVWIILILIVAYAVMKFKML